MPTPCLNHNNYDGHWTVENETIKLRVSKNRNENSSNHVYYEAGLQAIVYNTLLIKH